MTRMHDSAGGTQIKPKTESPHSLCHTVDKLWPDIKFYARKPAECIHKVKRARKCEAILTINVQISDLTVFSRPSCILSAFVGCWSCGRDICGFDVTILTAFARIDGS